MSENVRNASNVMVAAMRADATVLHFEPHQQKYFVRVRVDGEPDDGLADERPSG